MEIRGVANPNKFFPVGHKTSQVLRCTDQSAMPSTRGNGRQGGLRQPHPGD